MTEQLTREQVLAMEPGWELDLLVEHEVIGTRRPAKGWSINPRHYSTDISAAWEVVEQMGSNYAEIRRHHRATGINEVGEWVWSADLSNGSGHAYRATANSAPEAICKAALLAVMGI